MATRDPSIDVVFEDLNLLLSDLGIDVRGDEEADTKRPDIQPGSIQDKAFLESCRVVIDHVRTLERVLSSKLGEKDQIMEEAGGANDILHIAIERGMPRPTGSYSSNDCGRTEANDDSPATRAARVQALSFMCSELQLVSLESHQYLQQQQQQRRDINEQDLDAARRALMEESGECSASDERIRSFGVLFALQRVFQVSEQKQASFDQIESIMAAIAAKAEVLPCTVAEDGDIPLLAGLEMTPVQKQTVNKVQAAIAADFALRRRMILRRCDVTIQSFLRRKERESKNDEGFPPELKMKRDALMEDPSDITVDDALVAPRKVAWMHSRKIMEDVGATKTSTKMAEIADVPDRGGRVDATRAGPAMPTWTSRREFEGGKGQGRGRGGWHGGGRGDHRGGGGRSGGRDGGHQGGGGRRGGRYKRKFSGRGDRRQW